MSKKVIIFLILVLGLILRLYKIRVPLADHHSWRQVDSAAVIRNLAEEKFDLLRPRWDNLIPANAKTDYSADRYFFEDFPLAFDVYPALFYRIFGINVAVLRLSSVLFSIATIYVLFLLVRELSGFRLAALTSFIYAILPFSVFFSRGVFQENALNFYAVCSFYFIFRYLRVKDFGFSRYYWLAILTSALLFLTKPYALVFLLPQVYLFISQNKFGVLKKKEFWLYFILSLIPFVLWWFWARGFPEGMPYSTWLLNEGNIRFKGAFFHWIFAERLGKIILGYYGIFFFTAGILLLNSFRDGLFYVWLMAVFIFTAIIAKGSVTHDYYQIPFIPPLAYFFAKGLNYFLSIKYSNPKKIISWLIVTGMLLFSLAFSWFEVRNFYQVKSGIDLAGDYVDKSLPSTSLIIAGDGADPTLLYNCHRKGWTVGFGSSLENRPEVIENLRRKGAGYYVTTAVNQIKGSQFYDYLNSNYQLVKETDQFVVYSLKDNLKTP